MLSRYAWIQITMVTSRNYRRLAATVTRCVPIVAMLMCVLGLYHMAGNNIGADSTISLESRKAEFDSVRERVRDTTNSQVNRNIQHVSHAGEDGTPRIAYMIGLVDSRTDLGDVQRLGDRGSLHNQNTNRGSANNILVYKRPKIGISDNSSNNVIAPAERSEAQYALEAAHLVTMMSSTLRAGRESMTSKLARFTTVLSSTEKALLLNIARRFALVARETNVTYFLYGGALLGSYRHHDIIPWDDDMDVLVDTEDRYSLFKTIKSTPNYDVFMAGPRMKIFSVNSTRLTKYPWGWPYLDVSFYNKNATHIWDSSPEYSDFIYPKKYIFPLHKRPLAGFMFNAPFDTYYNLKLTYKSVDCTTHHYSHKYEKQKTRRRTTIPCDLLKHSVPFVHRTKVSSGVMEELKLGDSVIMSINVDEPSYAISLPYKLQLAPINY